MNDQERIEYLMSEIARLSNQVVDLQNERDALETQVELCNGVLKSLLKTVPWFGVGGSLQSDGQFYYKVAESVFKQAESALSITPQQALAQIRAEAVKDFVMFLPQYAYGINTQLEKEAEKYAARVRQGGEW